MKLNKGIQIACVAMLFIAIAAYIVYAMMAPSPHIDSERCNKLVINIEDTGNAVFLSQKDIAAQLHHAGLHPEGQLMKDISVKQIIQVLKQDQFIGTANCYKTANGKVVIDVSQRMPVLFVLPDNQAGYYIDADGGIIQNTDYPLNIIIATGTVDKQFATTNLNLLGAYITEDEFLNRQIEQIYLTPHKKKGQYDICLVPRIGSQNIHLGTIHNFPAKLERLKKFYHQALPSVGWNKYSDIELEYDNQIICKKTTSDNSI